MTKQTRRGTISATAGSRNPSKQPFIFLKIALKHLHFLAARRRRSTDAAADPLPRGLNALFVPQPRVFDINSISPLILNTSHSSTEQRGQLESAGVQVHHRNGENEQARWLSRLTVVSRHSQELCRQRMASRTSERVERPETLRHSRLNSVSSQFSDGAAASPSTRSSTSSWCEEPVPSNMDISTGHMILVRDRGGREGGRWRPGLWLFQG